MKKAGCRVKKSSRSIAVILRSTLLLHAGVITTVAGNGMLAEWDQAWRDFDQNYSYFTYKGIDWPSVYIANTNTFAQIQDSNQFAIALSGVLQVLRDWHVSVQKPNGTWLGYNGTYAINYPSGHWTNYTGGAPFADVHNAHAIYHAWMASTLAYIAVDTLSTTTFSPITDADIDAMFDQYKSAAGLILDLRKNTGGSEGYAKMIASHFTTVPRLYGYVRNRIPGNDHDAFTPFIAKTLQPAAHYWFTGEVGAWYTLLRATNLLNGSWEAAPGWTPNQPGLGGPMWYTNPIRAPVEFYRLRVGF
jgi:hypothetical protein